MLQCCGSATFWCWSGSDFNFWCPGPGPTLIFDAPVRIRLSVLMARSEFSCYYACWRNLLSCIKIGVFSIVTTVLFIHYFYVPINGRYRRTHKNVPVVIHSRYRYIFSALAWILLISWVILINTYRRMVPVVSYNIMRYMDICTVQGSARFEMLSAYTEESLSCMGSYLFSG